MKRYIPFAWWRCCILVFCLLGSSTLLAQSKLSTPNPPTINGNVASWPADTNASGYRLMLREGNEPTSEAERIDLGASQLSYTFNNLQQGITYEVRLRVLGDGTNYSSSDWSSGVTMTAPPLVYQGTLGAKNSGHRDVTHYVNINAGDQITANAICAVADDGYRRIDPKLYIYAPQGSTSWNDDDNRNVPDCVSYRSAQIIFTAPVSGRYRFLIENLANRSGPYRLEILGSTAATQPENDRTENDTQECSGGTMVSRLGEIGCIFSMLSDGGQRIDVYRVDSDSVGHHVLTVDSSQLGAAPASETLVASGYNGMFNVYYRPDGYLRITGGPNRQGKVYEVIVAGMMDAHHGDSTLTTMGTTSAVATPTPKPAAVMAVHVVQQGETVYSIASHYGVTVQAIVAANGIGADHLIHAGNRLNIPRP